MGSGKIIEAYSLSLIYHPEPKIFLQRLSLALGYNIKACFYNSCLIMM